MILLVAVPLVKQLIIKYNISILAEVVNSMAFESHTYSGVCTYRDIDFTFIFDGDELRLIPPVDKKETIRMDWINDLFHLNCAIE